MNEPQFQFRDQRVPARLCHLLQLGEINGTDLLLMWTIDALVRPQADKDGLGCWAKNDYLALACGCASKPYVSERLYYLRDKGLILIIQHEGKRYLELEWSRTAEEREELTGSYGKVLKLAHAELLNKLSKEPSTPSGSLPQNRPDEDPSTPGGSLPQNRKGTVTQNRKGPLHKTGSIISIVEDNKEEGGNGAPAKNGTPWPGEAPTSCADPLEEGRREKDELRAAEFIECMKRNGFKAGANLKTSTVHIRRMRTADGWTTGEIKQLLADYIAFVDAGHLGNGKKTYVPEATALEEFRAKASKIKTGLARWKADNDGRDEDGYDRRGYDKEGYDREGYDKDGYDRDGMVMSG